MTRSSVGAKLHSRLVTLLVGRIGACLIGCLSAACLAGCAHIPKEHLSYDIEERELSDHVGFLAQPSLNGRQPRTLGSWNARRYLKDRFKQYGLVPWGESKGYDQPFGYGTSVMGVLPGRDDRLRDEIVLVCAHYDHVGKDAKGRVCPGASDNASGVAALLEIAERLSRDRERPKRSVCFAAFDQEESFLLGSFAFTCREDFDGTKIAGVVNVDMLGRDLLDVVDNTLFVTGTERYPTVRKAIQGAAADAGVRLAPVGTDLVGPRGDHVAFESLPVPCLFFSCGMHRDYHEPTDTPDKLDYAEVRRGAEVICRAVRTLADAERIEAPVRPDTGDLEELRALRSVLAEISRNPEQAGLTAEQAGGLARAADRAGTYLARDRYTVRDRRHLAWNVAEVLLPVLYKTSWDEHVEAVPEKAQMREAMLAIHDWLGTHRAAVAEGIRQLVKHCLKHKPGLFRSVPEFTWETSDLADDDVVFTREGDNQCRASALLWKVTVKGQMKGLTGGGAGGITFSGSARYSDCRGTREEITDFFLLSWRDSRKDRVYDKPFDELLERITGEDHGDDYDAWLTWRLERTGCADESAWLRRMLNSRNPRVLAEAVSAAAETISLKEVGPALCRIVRDRGADPWARRRAIWALDKAAGNEALLALADVLDDVTPWEPRKVHLEFDPSSPFYHHPWVRLMRKLLEEEFRKEPAPPKTLGDAAHDKLRKLTGQDFGKDARAWREWIVTQPERSKEQTPES